VLIKGKTAFITGAAAGIGRATAIALGERGASRLMLCDLDQQGLAETAELAAATGAITICRPLDVTDHGALGDALTDADADDGLDIVFNNAGVVAGLPDFPDTSPERIASLISINLTAVIVGTALAVRLMRARCGGVIINTASTSVLRIGLADAPYRASKSGVVMLSQCCKDLNAQGIRVNAILPGITDTSILDKLGDGNGRPSWLDPLMRGIRVWTSKEIANGVISLIEDDTKAGDTLVLTNEAVL
jgi:NAD(P)-dependent dehydrogenase (short-subunit alcohol dehydrogenase family)